MIIMLTDIIKVLSETLRQSAKGYEWVGIGDDACWLRSISPPICFCLKLKLRQLAISTAFDLHQHLLVFVKEMLEP